MRNSCNQSIKRGTRPNYTTKSFISHVARWKLRPYHCDPIARNRPKKWNNSIRARRSFSLWARENAFCTSRAHKNFAGNRNLKWIAHSSTEAKSSRQPVAWKTISKSEKSPPIRKPIERFGKVFFFTFLFSIEIFFRPSRADNKVSFYLITAIFHSNNNAWARSMPVNKFAVKKPFCRDVEKQKQFSETCAGNWRIARYLQGELVTREKQWRCAIWNKGNLICDSRRIWGRDTGRFANVEACRSSFGLNEFNFVRFVVGWLKELAKKELRYFERNRCWNWIRISHLHFGLFWFLKFLYRSHKWHLKCFISISARAASWSWILTFFGLTTQFLKFSSWFLLQTSTRISYFANFHAWK